MKLSNVTREDAVRASQLANFLKAGKWQMSGEEIANYTKVVQWFHSLCLDMASQLPSEGSTQAKPVAAPKLVKSESDSTPKASPKATKRGK